MSKFVNFKFLLKFIFGIVKFSGFIFISIDLSSDEIKVRKYWGNGVLFVASFGLSFIANSYDAYLPTSPIAHSKILEIGTNVIVRLRIYITCFLKLASVIHSKTFFNIISLLQKGELSVRDFKLVAECESLNLSSSSRNLRRPQ